MRTYAIDESYGFRCSRAKWGAFRKFQPARTFSNASPREAAAIGRTAGLGIDVRWNAQLVNVMRRMLRLKREANAAEIDTALAATGMHPIVEVSTRDP